MWNNQKQEKYQWETSRACVLNNNQQHKKMYNMLHQGVLI